MQSTHSKAPLQAFKETVSAQNQKGHCAAKWTQAATALRPQPYVSKEEETDAHRTGLKVPMENWLTPTLTVRARGRSEAEIP